jgi:PAS domain S-box-containing protein
MVDALPAAVIAVDPEGRPLWANTTARVLAGLDDPIGAVASLLDLPAPEPGDPSPALGEALGKALAGDVRREAGVRVNTALGPVQRDLWLAPVRDGEGAVLGAVALLSNEEERLQALLLHTADVITLLEPDGSIRYSNPAAARLTGYEGRVMAGASAFDLVHPDDVEEALELFTSRLGDQGGGDPAELRIRHGDGTWRHVIAHLDNQIENPAVGGLIVTLHDITERKEFEARLAASEARLRAMVENLTDAIVVLGPDLRVAYASPAITRMIRQPLDETLGGSAFTDIHPDDVDRIRGEVQALVDEPGGLRRFELRLRHVPGRDEWRWLDVIAANRFDDPEIGGLVCTLRDITELKLAEARFREVVELAPDAMLVVDGDGRIALVNRQAERLFGYDRDDLMGEPVEVLMPEAVRARHEGHRAGYRADPRVREMGAGIELVARRADGVELPVEISLAPLDTEDGAMVSVSIRDVTERRRAEQALRDAYEHEREAAERLREVDQLKDDFLATVSHELRTPLTAIGGFARVLALESVAGAQRDELLERISANADQMSGMVEQLLDYSRLQAGKALVRPERLDLASLVTTALEGVAVRMADHPVAVEVPGGVAVVADREGVGHVLRNLLTNAAKFAPPGSTVTISAEVGADEVEIRVTDQGPGVAVAEQDQIFERFRQAHAVPPAGVRGTGLGLSIAKRYTEMQGGRIGVEAAPAGGASFWFTLPLG